MFPGAPASRLVRLATTPGDEGGHMRGRMAMVVGLLVVTPLGVGPASPAAADAVGAVRPHFTDAWGSTGSGNANLDDPKGVAVDPTGRVYVADTANDRIVEYDADGRFVRAFGSTPVN